MNLKAISAEDGDVSAKVSKIVSMDGDVDVSQRKGKVITLFDVRLQLEYQGTAHRSKPTWALLTWLVGSTKEEEDVTGSITIPEVAHDTEEDEYVVRSLCNLTGQGPLAEHANKYWCPSLRLISIPIAAQSNQ